MDKKRILFLGPLLFSYVREDVEILRKKYRVIELDITHNLLKIFLNLARSEIAFIWFADWHAFFTVLFSKILRKRSIVVVGGYDAVYMPEIDYGIFTSRWKGVLTKWVYRNADLILPVSNDIKKKILRFSKPKKIEIVYNGVDWRKFKPSGKKENIVITVANIFKSNVKRKNLETLIEVAKFLPEVKFFLIGAHFDKSIKYLRSIAPKNFKFTGYLPFRKLLRYYQRAKVYVQISIHEGFGRALAEAMSCECVPVVTRRGALPEVVGKVGFYVPCDKPEVIAKAIMRAIRSGRKLGNKARRRVRKLFSMERRRRKLIELLEDQIKGHNTRS